MSKRDQRIQRTMEAAELMADRLREAADAMDELSEAAYLQRSRARARRFERIVAGLQVTPEARPHELVMAQRTKDQRAFAEHRTQGPQCNLTAEFWQHQSASDAERVANRHAAIERMQCRSTKP